MALKYLSGVKQTSVLGGLKGTWFMKNGRWYFVSSQSGVKPQRSVGALKGTWFMKNGRWYFVSSQSGVKPQRSVGGLFDWIKKINLPKINLPTITLPKINLPNINLSKITDVIRKVGVAPSRASFLAAVRLNFMKLADRIAKTEQIAPGSIKAKWESYGGNWSQLKDAVNKGNKVGASIGVTGAEVLALTAAALPIIAGIVTIIKAKRGAADAADAAQDQAAFDAMAQQLDSGNITPPATESGALDTKTIMLLGGGAVALYLLTKKD